MDKLVSFVMPVRGGGEYFKPALNSILAQNYKNIEILIIDDGIDDEVRTCIAQSNDSRIRLIKSAGGGLVNSLNTGILNSEGSYIARMDSDDICEPERIDMQISVFNKFPDVDIVYSDVYLMNESGLVLRRQNTSRGGYEEVLPVLLYQKKGYPIVHPSVMMKKSAITEVEGYRHYDAAEDRDLWLRLCYAKKIFYKISKPLIKYRLNSSGVSSKKRDIQHSNSICSIINFNVLNETGFDIYKQNNELLLDISRSFESEFSSLCEWRDSFDELKNQIRSRNISKIVQNLIPKQFYIRELVWHFKRQSMIILAVKKYTRIAKYYLGS